MINHESNGEGGMKGDLKRSSPKKEIENMASRKQDGKGRGARMSVHGGNKPPRQALMTKGRMSTCINSRPPAKQDEGAPRRRSRADARPSPCPSSRQLTKDTHIDEVDAGTDDLVCGTRTSPSLVTSTNDTTEYKGRVAAARGHLSSMRSSPHQKPGTTSLREGAPAGQRITTFPLVACPNDTPRQKAQIRRARAPACTHALQKQRTRGDPSRVHTQERHPSQIWIRVPDTATMNHADQKHPPMSPTVRLASQAPLRRRHPRRRQRTLKGKKRKDGKNPPPSFPVAPAHPWLPALARPHLKARIALGGSFVKASYPF
ncbi:hypothetical protein C8R46DRAFT_1050908 [Mycena filopes]|nr:hypothetical protein C8R46DRAFT_1050908 [Mycena filopes]